MQGLKFISKKEKWGVGPLMAQAAHAATAVRIPLSHLHLFTVLTPLAGRFCTKRVSDKKRLIIWQTSRTCAR